MNSRRFSLLAPASNFRDMARFLHDTFEVESAAIFIVDEAAPNTLVLKASYTDMYKDEHGDVRLDISNAPKAGISGYLATLNNTTILNSKQIIDHPSSRNTTPHHLAGKKCHSLLAVPLVDRKHHLLGMLKLENKKRATDCPNDNVSFNIEEQHAVEMAATNIILILETRRLLEAIGSVVVAMQGLQDSENTLQQILNSAQAYFRADRGDFAIWNESKSDLVIAAISGVSSASTITQGRPAPKAGFIRALWADFNTNVRRRGDLSIESEYHCAYPGINSALAVRFELAGHKIGVMNIESFKRDYFDSEDEEALRMFARYGAIAQNSAAENSRFTGMLEHLVEDATSSQPTLRGILEAARALYGFEEGLVHVVNEEDQTLMCSEFVGREGLCIDPREITHSFDEQSAAMKAFKEKRGYYSPEPWADDNVLGRGARAFDITTPLVAVPLQLGTTVVGVLVCWSRNNEGPRKEHVELLKPLAQIAALKVIAWKAERALARSEREYRNVVDTLLDAKIFQKNKAGEFVFANRAFCNGLRSIKTDEQVTPETIKKQKDSDFYAADIADRFRRDDMKVLDTGERLDRIEQNPKPDGTLAWVQVFKTPLFDEAGQVVGVQGIFFDITGLVLKLSVAQDRLARLNKLFAVSAVPAACPHELRGPLSRSNAAARAIKLLLRPAGSLVKQQNSSNTIAEVRARAEDIIDESKRGLDFYARILKFLSSQQLDLKQSDVTSLINESLIRFLPELQTKSITVIRVFEPCAMIDVDREILKVVFDNVFTNARKNVSNNAKITVAVREIDSWIAVDISDTGPGFPQSILRQFALVCHEKVMPELESHKAEQNLGLGLVGACKIVELHGGVMDIRNDESGGAVIAITLPKTRKEL